MTDSDSTPSGASFLWESTIGRKIQAPELFTEEQREIARAARKFAATEILPRIAQIESKKPGLMPDLLRKAGELGLLMVDIPPEYGGLGLDKTTSMLIAEEFSVLGSFAVSLGAHTGIGTMPILYFGTPEQKAKYLPDLATGQRFAAYALTEPSSGSDALAARTRADLSNDGTHYLLNGTKQFITNAGFADVFTVFAQVGGTSSPRSSSIGRHRACPLAPRSTNSASAARRRARFLRRREGAERQSARRNRQGSSNRVQHPERRTNQAGPGTIGAAKCALEVAAKYAKERHQFNKPIGAFGLVASKLAEMAIGIFVGESMGYRTTGLIDARFAAGADEDAHVDAIEEFAVEASIIKVFGSEVLDYCSDECVQIHGGYGFIEEYQPERLLRDSRINRIFEGTNEINRLIVPATILKRAMKGQAPLIERAEFIRSSLAKGEVPRAGEGEFGVVSQVVEFCKWIATYVLAVAAETYHVHIADEQEILGELSDIISHVYALDSAVERVRLIMEGKSEMSKVVARDLLAAFAPPAYSFCVHTARHILMDVCDPESLPKHLEAIGQMRIDWPSKVIAAKRRIARAVLEADGYPIRRDA